MPEYERKHLFDGMDRIHYFVCGGSERFAVNSLAELTRSEYLYRLLREYGYERAVIVREEDRLYRAYAFDAQTQGALQPNQPKKAAAPLKGMERRRPAGTAAQGNAPVPPAGQPAGQPFGSRVIAEIIPENVKGGLSGGQHVTFSQFADTYFKRLIADRIVRTAVALPMTLLSEEMDAKLARDIRRSLEQSGGRNILVLTAGTPAKLGDLLSCAAFGELDDAVKRAGDMARARPVSPGVLMQSVLEGYDDEKRKEKENRRSRLVQVARCPGVDEVANYICRKKYRLQDPAYAAVRPETVYAMAEQVVAVVRDEEKHLPDSTAVFGFLDDPARVTALLKRPEPLWPRTPKAWAALPETALSRTVGRTERFALSEREQQALQAAAFAGLDEMVGMANVKEQVRELFVRQRYHPGGGPGHYVFAGPPGVGKTVTARMMGKLLKAAELLATDHVEEATTEKLVSNHVGESAIKTAEVCERALDGVLFVDEAYMLVNTESVGNSFHDQFCEEAYTTLMQYMENHRDRLCVIFAGYPDKMQKFLAANAGMPSRVRETVKFDNYSDDALTEIARQMAVKQGLTPSEDYLDALRAALPQIRKDCGEGFANARTMRDEVLEKSIQNNSLRIEAEGGDARVLIARDLPERYRPDETPRDEILRRTEEAMARLDGLIGLEPVKKELRALLSRKLEFPDGMGPGHYVFAGSPGTGKTTVAEMVGGILKAQGILRSGHLVRAPREELVGTVVGESGKKTLAKCKEALDGVLFIDEAYSLVNCDEGRGGKFADVYCEEAYTTLLHFMEDHRERVCVICAGYTDKMEKFMAANPGMRDRFSEVIVFPDYTDAELTRIFTGIAAQSGLKPDEGLAAALDGVFGEMKRRAAETARRSGEESAFANARSARKLFDSCLKRLATRLVGITDPAAHEEAKKRLTVDDLPEEYRTAAQTPDTPTEPRYARIAAEEIRALPAPFELDYPSDAKTLGAQTYKTILYVNTDHGQGTAFLIHPDGYALTCAHVVGDRARGTEYGKRRARMKLHLPGGEESEQWFEYRVINVKPEHDLALIKLLCDRGSEQERYLRDYCGGSFPYVALAEETTWERVPVGTDCIEQGYPFGKRMEDDYSQDPVSIKSYQRDGQISRVSLGGEGKHGNSGSPIISLTDGRVVGVFTGSITNPGGSLTEEINHMRPIQYFWHEFTM